MKGSSQMAAIADLPNPLVRWRRSIGTENHVSKNYAVGLEISCPGGAYYWAPEIPRSKRLAGPTPSTCELAHNVLNLSKTARSFGPASPALFEEVIDPVQSNKADEDQIDGHCEAHDPRRNQQKHSRDQGNDRQKVVSTDDVHPKLIADSDDSVGRHARRPRVGSAQADAMAPET
jgi:hypothetical protein